MESFISSSKILYSKPVVEKLTKLALENIHTLSSDGIIPGLAVVLVGENPASSIYVKNKEKFFLKNGCYSETFRFKTDISCNRIHLIIAISRVSIGPRSILRLSLEIIK